MKTCLVVDDSSVIRKVARRILERLNFNVNEAEDGAQALSLCEMKLPDAILLDTAMPNVDGYEFLRALRRMPGGDKPKVIICHVDNDLPQIARARHAGADEILLKPFMRDHVEAKFNAAGLL
ncbi:MAG TPA: response regulator [Xanthobacteraceae bacterium]|nr:response regulator [Xanthobacteraceae bacterium]